MQSIAVLGSGSWATAIVKILLHSVDKVYWWVREEEIIESLKKDGINSLYLSNVEFPMDRIEVSSNLKHIVSSVEDIVLVIPSAFVDDSLSVLEPTDLKNKNICSATKGIVKKTNQVIGEYLRDSWGVDLNRIAVVSGPSHAEEVALSRLTYLTLASQNSALAQRFAGVFSCNFVHVSLSEDVFGIEYAAVLKNIYALAVGIARGIGYGDNFVAVLVANALYEMENFLSAKHSDTRHLASAPYMGDLLVTAYSQFSRNRTFGHMIGRGYSVKSAILEMKMVAEGYYAAESIYEIIRSSCTDGVSEACGEQLAGGLNAAAKGGVHGCGNAVCGGEQKDCGGSQEKGSEQAAHAESQAASLSQISTPIIDAVYKILYKGSNPKTTLAQLEHALS